MRARKIIAAGMVAVMCAGLLIYLIKYFHSLFYYFQTTKI